MRERRLKQAIEIQNGVISPIKQPGFNDRQVRVQREQLQGSSKRSPLVEPARSPREEPARTEKQKNMRAHKETEESTRGMEPMETGTGGNYSSLSVSLFSLKSAFGFT
jgi:hypothetical protein